MKNHFSVFRNLPDRLLLNGWPRLACVASLLLLIIGKTEGRARRWYFHRMICRLQKMGVRNPEKRDFPCYVINRKCDTARLASFLRAAHRQGIEVERIEALNAKDPNFEWSRYDQWISDSFYGKKSFPKGTVGCFLSHLAVWHKIASGKAQGAFVFEDDAILLGPLPSNLRNFHFPKDADLVFCNRRMAENLFCAKKTNGLKKQFLYEPVFEVLKDRCSQNLYQDGCGTEAYFITKKAAKKIVSNPKVWAIFMNNDWHMVLNSMEKNELFEYLRLEKSRRFQRVKGRLKKRLNSYVMLPPLVELMPTESTITMGSRKSFIPRAQIRLSKKNENKKTQGRIHELSEQDI